MHTDLTYSRTANVRSINCKRTQPNVCKTTTAFEVPAQLGTLITLQLLLKQPILDINAVFDTVRIDVGLTLQLWVRAGEYSGAPHDGPRAFCDRIVALGQDALMEVVEQTPIIGIRQFGDNIADAEALWRHSQATALAAEVIASLSADVNPSMAYFGGLLHDIGKLRALLEQKTLRTPLDSIDLGREWARQYKLPAHVAAAINYRSGEEDEWLCFRRVIRAAHNWASSVASQAEEQDTLQSAFHGVSYSTASALPSMRPENRRALLKSLCAIVPACTV